MTCARPLLSKSSAERAREAIEWLEHEAEHIREGSLPESDEWENARPYQEAADVIRELARWGFGLELRP